ncbi:TMEM165/GDT1 family protein [Sphingopyxis sp. MWB1]|uniref:TMEM165/GDT1 family protein n=1 Tax=Sphingopyxis sp. MWB1 TaxID=1537715 RepID=UPI000AD1E581|nr:TMEM165/GDT1 family protein [Sphingopyxis sp. MWB1]
MIALVAVMLANADGRSGALLSGLLARRRDRGRVIAIAVGAFLVNAIAAAFFGAALSRMVGQGVVALLVAFALGTAALALLWRGRLMPEVQVLAPLSAPMLGARLTLAQLGDRSHFLIGALAATTGAGHWAAAGGSIGWVLAMLPMLAFGPALADHRGARWLRWTAAAVLAFWALRAALTAFGLIESR